MKTVSLPAETWSGSLAVGILVANSWLDQKIIAMQSFCLTPPRLRTHTSLVVLHPSMNIHMYVRVRGWRGLRTFIFHHYHMALDIIQCSP